MEQANDTTYCIDGVTYRLEPMTWQQTKWLGEHIFTGVDLQRLDYAVIHDLLRQKGPLFMAICLVPEGVTRKEHSRLAWSVIAKRAEDFAAELTGGEVAVFGPHFFRCCQPAQMAMLVPGAVLQAMLVEPAESSHVSGATGSNGVLSPSAAVISPKSDLFSPTGDRWSPIPTSAGASNGTPSTARSLDGAV